MPKTNQFVVSVTNLSKAYSQAGTDIPVLNDLTLSIQRGESAAILGVSGTGKSTLLNILGGIDTADQGTLEIGGQNIAKLNSTGLAKYRREKVGFIFQFYNLIPTLTAAENVMTGWEAAGKSLKDAADAARDILSVLELSDKADRFPEQLSGGEQQRVAIARALVKRPAIVLADEPTGNLDPKTAAITTQLLLNQTKRFSSALIIVTHNPQLVEHTDHALILSDGRLTTVEASSLKLVSEASI